MPGSPTPYWDHIIPAAYRILGNLDRLAGSPSEGSLSRDSWLYRFGGGFHPATRQCAFYPLAMLYSGPSQANPFHASHAVLRSIQQILAFTVSIQNRDGSFPEWYREHSSYCATAYLAAYMSEVILTPSVELDTATRNRLTESLDSAADYLSKAGETASANQVSAALLALRNAACILGTAKFTAALKLRDRLIASQADGGWLPENGGPDLGYQSLSLDFLTRCVSRGMDGLEHLIESGLGFLDRFVPPDGSSPPAISWRGTGFLMPYAVERWAASSAPARRLAIRVRSALAVGLLPTPATVDDRYAAHLFLPSFVDAGLAAGPIDVSDPAGMRLAATNGDTGGLRIIDGGDLRTWIQARKGAVVVYSESLGRIVWENPYYCLRIGGTAWFPAPCESGRFDGKSEYRWESVFRRIRGGEIFTRAAAALAPAASAVCARLHDRLPMLLAARIRHAAFQPGPEAPVRLTRHVSASPEGIRIRDVVEARRPMRHSRLFVGWHPPHANQPASGFFSAMDLIRFRTTAERRIPDLVAREWTRAGRVELETLVSTAPGSAFLACTVNGREIPEEGNHARVLH